MNLISAKYLKNILIILNEKNNRRSIKTFFSPSTKPSQLLKTTGATVTDASTSPASAVNPSSRVFTTETVAAFTQAITTTQANTGANIEPIDEDTKNRSEITMDDLISGESTTADSEDRASVDDAEQLTIDLEHTTDTPEVSSETLNKESEGYLETFIELEVSLC